MKPLLDQADKELKKALFAAGHRKRFHADETIFSEGDKALFLPIVIAGKIKMVRFPEPGKEVIIGIFGPGEMFAVPPAFDGRTFPSTAIAMETTELLIVGRDAALEIIKRHSSFSLTVIQWMCEMLREKTATIQTLTTASPEHRVADVLVRLAERENAAFPFQVPVRRQDIAEMAGLTTETTIRAVKKLSDKGLVRIVRGKIIIPELRPLSSF